MSHCTYQTVYNPANAPSARFFAGLGITAGMRVLDVGCGNGDLSRFIAGLAGPGGDVVAIDRSEDALAIARATAMAPHAAPVRYCRAELASELPDFGNFDAIVGRRVLMYLPDCAAALARLARLAKPGAILAFQEHARAGLPAGLGVLALHRQLYDWVWSTVSAEGGDAGLALRLVDLMQAIGFTIERRGAKGCCYSPASRRSCHRLPEPCCRVSSSAG
jgi:ubiquinone/menaquinone biosynthesis C-methylase UbiE